VKLTAAMSSNDVREEMLAARRSWVGQLKHVDGYRKWRIYEGEAKKMEGDGGDRSLGGISGRERAASNGDGKSKPRKRR